MVRRKQLKSVRGSVIPVRGVSVEVYPVVMVRWEDSKVTNAEWVSLPKDEAPKDDPLCQTVGFEIHRTKKWLTVFPHLTSMIHVRDDSSEAEEDQGFGDRPLPMKAVHSVRKLGVVRAKKHQLMFDGMPLVLVDWVDSHGCSTDWTRLDHVVRGKKKLGCQSVGYQKYEGSDCIILFPHVTMMPVDVLKPALGLEARGSGDITIPTVAVVKIKKLGFLT